MRSEIWISGVQLCIDHLPYVALALIVAVLAFIFFIILAPEKWVQKVFPSKNNSPWS